MEPEFWHERWAENRIGFHEGETNAALAAHFDALGLARGARVFVPLCGKTRDIAWLLDQGMRVAGAELSDLAVRQLFDEMQVTLVVAAAGPLTLWRGGGAEIFCGDIFDLGAGTLGPVDAVYDRAALVALPAEMRAAYAAHLTRITAAAPQLTISFEYDQTAMDGPPFSVPEAEVRRLYGETFALTPVETHAVPGGFRGGVAAEQTIWLMRRAEA